MKIIILGKGLAGCFTALHFKHYRPNFEVELIHDSNTPALPIGQGTFLEVPQLLWEALGLDWYNNPIKATPKTGVLYEGWGTKNDKWFHPFPLSNLAIHYDPHTIQDYIIENCDLIIKDEVVDSLDEIDADYIFDCRGYPKDYTEYEELRNPINSVILGQNNKTNNTLWTTAKATPDGWCWIIPTTEITSYGYLYNSQITDIVTARKNFADVCNPEEIMNDFTFKNYLAKNPIQDRVILNGNRLFFLEPLEATSIAAYINWIRLVFDCIILKNITVEETSEKIRKLIKEVENFIAYHYMWGSKYKTPFWEYARNFKVEDNNFWAMMLFSIQTTENLRSGLFEKYGVHHPMSFKAMHDGMGEYEIRSG